jgi:hypothetical protein
MEPRAGLDDLDKRKFLIITGLELRAVVQPVASRCTDYATPAPIIIIIIIIISRIRS